MRVLAVACVLGIGYFIGIVITGALIFLLSVPLAETAARWLSAALAVALTIWFVTRRRTTWSAEDAATT
jgi:thiol:disulfide interchange protein